MLNFNKIVAKNGRITIKHLNTSHVKLQLVAVLFGHVGVEFKYISC